MRLGDSAIYDNFDGVSEVIESLREAEVHGPFGRVCGRHGVMAPGHEGCNYISLYWGDRTGSFSRDLSVNEFRRLSDELK